MRRMFAVIFLLAALPLYSSDIILGLGIHTGFLPAMGGSLTSTYQEDTLSIKNGVYRVNRKADGIATSRIDPLLGRSAGFDADFIFLQYIILKFSLNAAMDQYGGVGVTVDDMGAAMNVTYSMMIFDLPAAVGISIPVSSGARIAVCAGLAPSYGIYENNFQSANYSRKGSFSGFAAPLVIIIKGDYFVTENISASSSFSAYRGAGSPSRSGTDYARIDFSGLRWEFGAVYYIKLVNSLKRSR